MDKNISIITPAYRANDTIARAARSVVGQTHQHWEWIIVGDDPLDYEAVLGRAGILDDRFRFLSTGENGSGSPPARNIGIDAAQYRYSAILDADDFMHEEKLTRAMQHLPDHGIVSCALAVTSNTLEPLRSVAEGSDRTLLARDYKFVNFSGDSMLVYDRQKADPRFNPEFPCLTDIEFALKLFAVNESCFHLGTPLHSYVKEPSSISNKPGASLKMIETKKRLLEALGSGQYPLADSQAVASMMRFYELSLDAERGFETKLKAQPGILFEDHLEPKLRSAISSSR